MKCEDMREPYQAKLERNRLEHRREWMLKAKTLQQTKPTTEKKD